LASCAHTLAQQPELTTLKSPFVAGEKTLFYDDFSDQNPGDAPARFKIRGSGVELKAAGDIRQLTVSQRGSIFPNVTTLPKNFTFEAEVKAETTNRSLFHVILLSKDRQALVITTTASPKESMQQTALKLPKYEHLGRKTFPVNWGEPVKLAFWIQDGRLRTFVNGEKQQDFNQVELPPIDGVEFAFDFYGANQSIGLRSVRFAESTPDFSQTIMSSGRYITYGILFDTGSDRLKPESAAVIQSIAKGLEANAGLKLLIEGHTDSAGQAAANLDLSKRRAEAVKGVLVSQFKIDAARLTTAGLGATKPIGPNDTPQGRANNRRVELVKQ
jgi:outer membrane protein OmpA-like peptidoglycan-associated protein